MANSEPLSPVDSNLYQCKAEIEKAKLFDDNTKDAMIVRHNCDLKLSITLSFRTFDPLVNQIISNAQFYNAC